MSQARIRLNGMRFFGRIGHTEEERIVGTHVEVDVQLTLPVDEDPVEELAGTVDYREIHRVTQQVVEGQDHPLLEGLAAEILTGLEALAWEHARVTVRKPSPPFDAQVKSAEVELERSR